MAECEMKPEKWSCVSSPGKVLLTGGYCILERPNSGIVLSTTARFYASSQWMEIINRDHLAITVDSPQFHKTYKFICKWPIPGGFPRIEPMEKSEENEFIQCTLQYTLLFADARQRSQGINAGLHGELNVILQADNDFYSQLHWLEEKQLPVTVESLRLLPKFQPAPTVDGSVKISKTGMGSSATLVTSLVGSILSSMGILSLPKRGQEIETEELEQSRRIVHRLAQICHSAAQGKIGSGFDVSAAVYGTHVYTRFSPIIISSVLQSDIKSALIYKEILAVVEKSEWNCIQSFVDIPTCFSLLMGDIRGGSSTTSMVRMVMKWRDAEETKNQATEMWNDLSNTNKNIIQLFKHLSDYAANTSTFDDTCARLASLTVDQWDYTEHKPFLDLRNELKRARSLLKMIGKYSKVPIEPDQQTELANQTMALPGVLCAGVPGAGGVDALFAITVHPVAIPNVQKMWAGWNDGCNNRTFVCPLTLLNERDPHQQGIRLEENVA